MGICIFSDSVDIRGSDMEELKIGWCSLMFVVLFVGMVGIVEVKGRGGSCGGGKCYKYGGGGGGGCGLWGGLGGFWDVNGKCFSRKKWGVFCLVGRYYVFCEWGLDWVLMFRVGCGC